LFVAEGFQYAMRMPARLYSNCPQYLINGKIFEQRFIEHKMCVTIVCTNLSETFLILRRIERDVIYVCMYVCMYIYVYIYIYIYIYWSS
jgi:hypothetical protein